MRYPADMTREEILQFEFEYNLWSEELDQINLECQIVAQEQRLTDAVVVL
jgi:hypothetical protein